MSSSYSSNRLDLTGDNVAELTKGIATSQPWLAWLHSGKALRVYKDPYILAALADPIGAVKNVYNMQDPEGRPIGRQYLNSLFQEEMGHEITDSLEDLAIIGSKYRDWIEQRLTGFRVIEMITYLSAADSAEKIIAGSLIKEAAEAQDKNQAKDLEEVDTEGLPPTVQSQILELKEKNPELYELLVMQMKQGAAKAAAGVGYPLNPLFHPDVGETESGEEQQEPGQDPELELMGPPEGLNLRAWSRQEAMKKGVLERLGDFFGDIEI